MEKHKAYKFKAWRQFMPEINGNANVSKVKEKLVHCEGVQENNA